MKIAISHKGIKRSIEGPFKICLSDEERKRLIECLKQAASGPEVFVYGWIDITDYEYQNDSSPLAWDAPAAAPQPNITELGKADLRRRLHD